jgi:hypothetical protein
MKRLLTLSVAVAAVVITVSAHASLIDARFSGTVSSQTGNTFAPGSTINGEFIYDIGTSSYTFFKIAGQSVAPGYGSSADFSPDMYTALYRAQLSPVQQGGTLNSTFIVDLEALSVPWSSADPIALLTSTAQLASNLDRAASTFSYYTGNVDGTNIESVTAALDGLVITAVPEPATVFLFAAGAILFRLRSFRWPSDGATRHRR